MRVGIIGAGSMARVHAAGWMETDADLVSVYSKNAQRVKLLAEQLGITPCLTVDELIDSVDIVDICTPTNTHSDLVRRAAAAGTHILCEKPLALSYAEGAAMVRCCNDSGVRMMVAHVLRFFPEYRQAKQMIASNEYGTPAVLRLYRHCFSPQIEGDNWFLDRNRSGGVGFDLALHDIDFALWTAGAARRVYAAFAHRDPTTAKDEHIMIMLEHTNGAISHIEGSWAFPPPTFRMGFEIALPTHLLTYDSLHSNPLTIHMAKGGGGGGGDGVPQPSSASPYSVELAAFYDSLVNDTPFPIELPEALEAVRIAELAVRAATSGEVQIAL